MSKLHYISYSQMSLALACPLLYFEMYAKGRRKELSPETKAMVRGKNEHTLYEGVMKGQVSIDQGAAAAINPRAFAKTFKLLDSTGLDLLSEGEIKIPYNDKYGLVMIADVISDGYQEAEEVYLADFKTGRKRESDFNQLDFYSYILMRQYPNIKRITQNIIGIGFDSYLHPERVFTREDYKKQVPEIENTLSYVIDSLEDRLPHDPQENFRCSTCLLSTCPNYVEDK